MIYIKFIYIANQFSAWHFKQICSYKRNKLFLIKSRQYNGDINYLRFLLSYSKQKTNASKKNDLFYKHFIHKNELTLNQQIRKIILLLSDSIIKINQKYIFMRILQKKINWTKNWRNIQSWVITKVAYKKKFEFCKIPMAINGWLTFILN